MAQFKLFIFITFAVLAVIFSGCTSGRDVTPIVKTIPEVQQFLKEHPNAKITVTYWSKEEVEKIAQEISQQCDKPITPVAMYKATVSDGDLKIVSWINEENQKVICSITEGKGLQTNTSAPTPTATQTLTATMTPTVTPTSIATPIPQITPVATTVSTTPVPVTDKNTLTNSIGIEFIPIPAGEFDMGSPITEPYRQAHEGPVHHVTLRKAFYMGKYEVTQRQWRDIMGNNPSYFKDNDRPVEQVSWNDVQEFIKRLNEKEVTDKYRLPSEAEWEYAARAGTTTMFSFGDDESKLGDYAWYQRNEGERTHPVGQKKPNPWGLYDMHGNVWEWVQDRTPGTKYWTITHETGWDEYVQDRAPATYDGAPADGSAWESKDYMDLRVERGGNFRREVKDLRSATRFWDRPDGRFRGLGFRLVKDL